MNKRARWVFCDYLIRNNKIRVDLALLKTFHFVNVIILAIIILSNLFLSVCLSLYIDIYIYIYIYVNK